MSGKTAAETFRQYSRRLLEFIRARVKLPEDAEDILQDVFYQLSRIDNLINPVENTAAWLYRATRNRIIDHYRKKKELPLPSVYNEDEDEVIIIEEIADILSGEIHSGNGALSGSAADTMNESPRGSRPETDFLRTLIMQEIESAIAELPEEQRKVFEFSEFHAMPVKEIAEKTGTSVNTVLSRKHYAVMHLRKRLRELYSDIMGI